MSLQSNLSQIKTFLDNISKNYSTLASFFHDVRSRTSDQSFEEIWRGFTKVENILRKCCENSDLLSDLLTSSVVKLTNFVKNIDNEVGTWLRSGNQAQDKSNLLESLASHITNVHESLLSNGVYFKIQYFENPKTLAEDLRQIQEFIEKIPNHEQNLQRLLQDGAVGRLALAVNNRKNHLFKSKLIFGLAATIAICGAIWFSYDLLKDLELILNDETKSDKAGYAILIARGLCFIPIYLLVSFLWKGYSAERKLEEEYGFREAILGIVPSLPTYMTDEKMRLEISTNALNRVLTELEKPDTEIAKVLSISQVAKLMKAIKGQDG